MPSFDDAQTLIKQGHLAKAREQLVKLVKEDPGHHAARNAYFETLCFQGDYERARSQLETLAAMAGGKHQVMGQDDPRQVINLYHNALLAEEARSAFFEEGRVPEFLRQPPDSVKHRMEAALEMRAEHPDQAASCLQAAEELEEPVTFTMRESELAGFRDADDLFGPILEFLSSTGDYVWIELARCVTIYPGQLRHWLDTLWRPATLLTRDAGMVKGLIPVLYVGSSKSDQEQIQVGHMTDWIGDPEQYYRGLGQRLFLAGAESYPVLDLAMLESSLDISGDEEEAGK